MQGDETEARRSTRETKGKGPQRYGSAGGVLGQQRRNRKVMESEPVAGFSGDQAQQQNRSIPLVVEALEGQDVITVDERSKGGSVRSKLSSVSSVCSLKKKESHLKALKEIAKLDEMKKSKQRIINDKELEILMMEESLEAKKTMLSELAEEDETKDALTKEVARDQRSLDSKVKRCQLERKNLELDIEALDREITVTAEESDVEKARIDEEYETALSSEEEEVDEFKNIEVANWAFNSSREPTATVEGQNESSSQQSEEQSRLKTLQEQRSKHEAEVKIILDEEEKIAEALRQQQQPKGTCEGSSSNFYPDQMNTMLARQSHSKDLPYFSGFPEEWLQFKCTYERTNRLCKFSIDENLNRLQKCLKGDALRLVQSLMTTPLNVDTIMKKLEMRFGQPEFIIEALTQKVRNTPPLKMDNLETVIEFGCSVDSLTTTLRALNCPEHMHNPVLLKELEGKLPTLFRVNWRKWLDEDPKRVKGLEAFADWLENETRYACALCPPKATTSKDKEVKKPEGGGNFRKQKENVLVTEEHSEEKKVRICSFCSAQGHRIMDCRKFKKEDYEERMKVIRSKRLCFKCLNYGHRVGDCRSKETCTVDGCGKNHHHLVHQNRKSEEVKKESDDVHKEEVKTVAHTSKVKEEVGEIVYQIIDVILRGPDRDIEAYAFLDGGSGYTMLETSMANKLGLKKKKNPFSFKGLGSTIPVPDSSLVDLKILSRNRKEFDLKNVRTYDNLDLPCRTLSRQSLSKFKHLKGIDIKPYVNAKPVILIGLPHADLIMHLNKVEGPKGAPIAVETKLGWLLCGNLPRTQECKKHESVFAIHDDNDAYLHQLVKDHFSTEDFGVKLTVEKPRSSDDKRALQIMEDTAKKEGSQWELGLLWRYDDVNLPESYSSAERRLKSIEKKMDLDPDFGNLYCNKLDEYKQKGFIRKLSAKEASEEGPKCFYLPHFGVVNPNKPGKFRLVFDAAARSHGVSLNDQLLTGPDFVPSLPGVLFRFRERAIALTADISDMFHMVRIRKEDQDAQRFLWRGMDRDRKPDVYVMSVMVFGAASSPSCAQYIKNRNAEEEGQAYPEAVQDIIRNHYVDDFLRSNDDVETAYQRAMQVYEIHQKGNFNICKFISNSAEFNNRIPEELRASGVQSLSMGSSGFTERVLGLHWEPSEDLCTFKTIFHKVKPDVISGERVPSKREALALIMSVFDPIGFLSLFTVKAKMMLQETWRSGTGWDEELPESMKSTWLDWVRELNGIPSYKVPRCYSLGYSKSESIQLHIFVDASEKAFAAVGYFRIESNGAVEVSFVSAKAKVAPLKPLSIPRMELQAAVMGCRLARFIQDEHEVKCHRVVYWSDSRTVLCWLRSDGRKYQQFVSHRIGEIQEETDVADWKWIPTAENVADEATRGNKPSDFSPTSRWVNGPKFLKLSESEWPKEEVTSEMDPDVNMEMKKGFVAVAVKDYPTCPIQIERFSNWMRLLRSTAYVLKAVKSWKAENDHGLQISVPDLENAEEWWWRWSQEDSYGNELKLLKAKKSLPKSCPIANLCPWIDEKGIMRVLGRIPEKAEVYGLDTNPVILHPKHPLTVLLIMYYHWKNGHHGMEKVVNELRQRYCIPSIRAAVKRAWASCLLCKIMKAEPVPPRMGNLPIARINSFVHPFTVTGLDYFGPMEVTIGRRREKRYGELFTCMSTRAVHLEIAASLSTDSCIMAIRRFISRRGHPNQIFSDNGTNFKGAHNELKKALAELDQEKIQNEMTTRGINWNFIPPAAPHMGGCWERLVRSVKVALAATLHTKAPKEEVLQTLMIEAENTVNGRPLTHVSCDPDDAEALTPNHFLIGRSSNIPSWRRQDDAEKCIKKQWEQAQQLADLFWRRWVSEYLPTLTRREKWFQEQKPIQVGDIVILVDNNQPRNCWPKGRVVATYPGKDGQVRTVDVKTALGVYRRPVVKVCVLDIQPNNIKNDDEKADEDPVKTLVDICSSKKRQDKTVRQR